MEVTLRGGRAPRSAEQNDIKKLWRFTGLDASGTGNRRRDAWVAVQLRTAPMRRGARSSSRDADKPLNEAERD